MKTTIAKLAPVFTSLLCTLSGALHAAGYSQAQITRLYNEVKVLKENVAPQTAAVGQQILPVTSVATGAGSRAELKFPDQSLTRLGANSRFTLRGDSRTLDLEKGTMLLQVPEKILGAKVRTAAVTAAVTGGTALIEYLPGGYVKLIVVEGFVDLFMNNDPSNFKQFHAGEMLIMKADSPTIPDAVDVDLKVLLKTSKLISGNDQSEINQDLVNQAVQAQQQKIQSGELQPTNLSIPGQGTYVVLNTDNSQVTNVFNNFGLRNGPPGPGGPQGPQGAQGPGNNGNGPINNNPAFQGFAPLISGRTILNGDATIRTNPHITAANIRDGVLGTISYQEGILYRGLPDGHRDRDGDGLFQYFVFGNTAIINPNLQPKINEPRDGNNGYWAVFKFEDLNINGTVDWVVPNYAAGTPAPDMPITTNVALTAQRDIHIGPSGMFPEDNIPDAAGGVLDGSESPITILNLDAEGSDHIDTLLLYSNKGSVIIRNPTGDTIRGYNQDVIIVAASLSSDVIFEGSIFLNSFTGYGSSELAELAATAGRNIDVTDASLTADDISLRAGNTVNLDHAQLTSNKGNIAIRGAKGINISNSSQLKTLVNNATMLLQAQTGNINISDSIFDAAGSTIELTANTGNITLNNLSVTASDVFKAQTLGPNGTITIGGTTINASTLIDLYAAGGNGLIKFIANSELNSPSVKLKANTVEVLTGVTVHVPQRNITIEAANMKFQGAGGTDVTKGTISPGTSLHTD